METHGDTLHRRSVLGNGSRRLSCEENRTRWNIPSLAEQDPLKVRSVQLVCGYSREQVDDQNAENNQDYSDYARPIQRLAPDENTGNHG